MKKTSATVRVLFCVLLMGMLGASLLLGHRIALEQKNYHISTVMSFEDAESLADASGISVETCLSRLASGGLSAVVLSGTDGFFDASAAEAVSNAGLGLTLAPTDSMTVSGYLAARQALGADFPLYLSVGGTVSELSRTGLTVGLVEDAVQYSHEAIPGFDAGTEPCPMVRVFRLLPEYQARYAVFGHTGAEEIENILYRAATDRSIRVLWLTPFLDPDTGAIIGDFSEYTGLLEGLSLRLIPHGLLLDGTIFPIEAYDPSPVLLFFCFLGLAAAAVFLLETLFPVPPRVMFLFLLLGAAMSAAGLLAAPQLTAKGMALGAAVVFPCLASFRLAGWLNESQRSNAGGAGITAARSVRALLGGLGITLIGCLFVGAILSGSHYLLSIDTFTGVKASQALPLLYAVIMSAILFWYQPGKPIAQQGKELFSRLNRRSLFLLILFLVILAGAGAFFVWGTGDGGLLRGGLLERRFRNLLEAVVPVRPRLKEFLAAWPALVLASYLAGRGHRGWAWLLILPSAAGFASVCNTFCHIRASVVTSLLRTLYGASLGYCFGLVCVLLVWLVFFRRKNSGSETPRL